jgi:hypothetical protein
MLFKLCDVGSPLEVELVLPVEPVLPVDAVPLVAGCGKMAVGLIMVALIVVAWIMVISFMRER